MKGKPWCQATLESALAAVKEDVAVPPGAPGGRAEYRNSLAASFLFKFYVWASLQLEREGEAAEGAAGGYRADVPASFRSAAVEYHRPPVKGVQFFAKADESQVVGQDYRHMSADYQVG
jgi:xanthine dehydrogenase/oxidase